MKKIITMLLAATLALEGTCAMADEGIDLKDFGNEERQFDISSEMEEAPAGDIIAMDDVGISVCVDSYSLIEQDDGFVYIYPYEADSYPYVIIGRYDFAADDFADQFTEYMAGNYQDLYVAAEKSVVTLGGKEFVSIEYGYTVQEYDVTDKRLFGTIGNYTYMFGSKSIYSLGLAVEPGFLETVAGSYAPLAGGDSDYEKHVDKDRFVSGNKLSGIGGQQAPGTDVTDVGQSEVGGSVGSSGSVGSARSGGQGTGGSIVFTEKDAVYEGTWVEFDDGFKLYLPSSWTEISLSEEDKQDGTLYIAGDIEGGENAPYVLVQWFDQYDNMETVTEEMRESGFRIDGAVKVNGIDCMSFAHEEEDMSGLLFWGPLDNSLLFTVIGGGYSSNVDTIASALCSLDLR